MRQSCRAARGKGGRCRPKEVHLTSFIIIAYTHKDPDNNSKAVKNLPSKILQHHKSIKNVQQVSPILIGGMSLNAEKERAELEGIQTTRGGAEEFMEFMLANS